MRIPLVTFFLERRTRNRLRAVMRGHRALRAFNQADKVAKVKDALKHHKVECSMDRVSERLFGAALPQAELAVRQYMLVRFGGPALCEALLASVASSRGRVAVALPPEWRRILVAHGIRVAHLRSKVVWQAYVAVHLFFGVALFAKHFIAGVRSLFRPASQRVVRYVYFDALTPNALPRPAADASSHDIMTWYWSWTGRAKKVDALCHGLKNIPPTEIGNTEVFPMEGPVAALDRPGALIAFLVWGVVASLEALVDALRGRWVHAMLLGEAVKAAQAKLQHPGRMAQEYLFHNSSCLYRPLWTYEAERAGSEIVMYFYSTNCEPFKRSDGYPRFSNDYYEVMSWPRYMVWDSYQADFIRRSVGEGAKIEIVGPIWFSSSVEDLPSLPSHTVAMFDVQPVRTSFYQRLGIDFDYYVPANATAFLADCHAAAQACGATVALKRKREIGTLIHPVYESFIARLSTQDGFMTINSDASAFRLIERCVAVISMPFTSTALIGRALGKPSVYYDPCGMIQKDDRGGHGIAILRGLEELQAWLSGVVNIAGSGDRGLGN